MRSLYWDRLDEEGYVLLVADESKRLDTLDLAHYAREVGPFEKNLEFLQNCKIYVHYYGDGRGRPVPAGKRKKHHPELSHFSIRHEVASFRSDGTTGLSPIFFSGEMARRGAAWLLPADYAPEGEKRRLGGGGFAVRFRPNHT